MTINVSSITDNIARIRERIARSADRSGRHPHEITLVAVTKTVSTDCIEEAVSAGVRDFGENYVQEARNKIPIIQSNSEHADISLNWHLIGHLQSNKVKYAIPLFQIIESADNYQLLQEIERQAAKRDIIQHILIEVNLTDNAGRSGVSIEGFPALVEMAMLLPHIELRGVMGIAPIVATPDEARPFFGELRKMWETLPVENRQVLSMGMSGDFEAAILEGATQVRIGSSIFGPRLARQESGNI